MLTRRDFDPFNAIASPRDLMSAHVLLSDARGSNPKTSTDEVIKDLELFRNFTHGATKRPSGFMLYDDPTKETVGMAHVTEFPGTSVLSLDALAVRARYRGDGLGAEILDDVINLSVSRGLGRVSLRVDRGNKRAQQLYASRSFVIEDEQDSHYYMVRGQVNLLP